MLNIQKGYFVQKKLNTTRIEKNGVLAIQNFLSESTILDAKINWEDKYPIWDGDIFLYKNENLRFENKYFIGRVPVQVKATHRDCKKIETYSISKILAGNYLNDGGVLLLRIIGTSVPSMKIYVASLLPVKIIQLNKKYHNKKNIKVPLRKITKLKELEVLIGHFIENRKLQYNFSDCDVDDYLKGVNTLVFKSIRSKSFTDDLLSDNSFIYVKDKFGSLIPTSLQLQEIGNSQNIRICINEKEYFSKIQLRNNRDIGKYIFINTALRIRISGVKLDLDYIFNDEVLVHDAISAAEFLFDIGKYKYFSINNTKASCNVVDNFKLDDNSYQNWKTLINFCKDNKIDYSNITFKMIDENEQLLIKLINTLDKNTYISFDHKVKQKSIFKIEEVFGKKLLIFFEKIDEKNFTCKNYLKSSYDNLEIKINSSLISCSKYIALLSVFKDSLSENIDVLFGYEDNVSTDLIDMYDYRAFEEYNYFILECIKGFDKFKNDKLLSVSRKIINTIDNQELSNIEHNIIRINFLQIEKRNRILNKSEIIELLDIKEANKSNFQLICCINILLENYIEFKISFDKLSEKEQNEFKYWPIWKLYSDRLDI